MDVIETPLTAGAAGIVRFDDAAGAQACEPSRFTAYAEGATDPVGHVERMLFLVERALAPGLGGRSARR